MEDKDKYNDIDSTIIERSQRAKKCDARAQAYRREYTRREKGLLENQNQGGTRPKTTTANVPKTEDEENNKSKTKTSLIWKCVQQVLAPDRKTGKTVTKINANSVVNYFYVKVVQPNNKKAFHKLTLSNVGQRRCRRIPTGKF